MYPAVYPSKEGYPIFTSYHPDNPGEGNRPWLALARVPGLDKVGSWGYSEAQALNNFLKWVAEVQQGE